MADHSMSKIKTLFFPILLFLVSFSLATAQWSDTLKLHVGISVGTGYDCVSLSNWSCSDLGADQQALNYSNPEGKNVASCSLIDADWDDLGNVVALSMTLNNAYPGYMAIVTFNVTNTGTLPVKLYSISENFSVLSNVINVTFIPPSDIELDPGESHNYVLQVEVLQSINENSTYIFEIKLTYTYWANHKKTFIFTSYKSHACWFNLKNKCICEEGLVDIVDGGSKAIIRFSDFKDGWGWIGLVISNNVGKLVTLSRDDIVVYVNNDADDVRKFLYGSFTSVGNSGVWGYVDICNMLANMYDDGNPFPSIVLSNNIDLPSNGKAILWVFIKGDAGPKEIIIQLMD